MILKSNEPLVTQEEVRIQLGEVMKKVGRNDLCSCGSGKKFKKCCESRILSGRFLAQLVDVSSAAPLQKTIGLTSMFQGRLAATPKKLLPVNSVQLEKKEDDLIS